MALMPFARVPKVAKGTSRVVYMPPLKRKPCSPLALLYSPTIWPMALMP
jgi:hypothetical protein